MFRWAAPQIEHASKLCSPIEGRVDCVRARTGTMEWQSFRCDSKPEPATNSPLSLGSKPARDNRQAGKPIGRGREREKEKKTGGYCHRSSGPRRRRAIFILISPYRFTCVAPRELSDLLKANVPLCVFFYCELLKDVRTFFSFLPFFFFFLAFVKHSNAKR